jgi:ubiquinone/menaquinone biosynthesis C-methylase UbiE
MWLPFKILFGRKAKFFFEFKERASRLSEKEFATLYEETRSVHIDRPTDLNTGCLDEITKNILGDSVLDVGCGRGFLAGTLSKRYRVTACDMIISEKVEKKYPNVHFRQENNQRLSFADKEFDTVISSHTLEHVQDGYSAIEELRRVAKRRLIVVLPKQRPYRYTFDLHLRFFPYPETVLQYLRSASLQVKYELKEIAGDWYYQEDKGL